MESNAPPTTTIANDRNITSLISVIKDGSRRFGHGEMLRAMRELMTCILSGQATASTRQAKEAINALRSERRFAEMKMLSDFFIRTGTDAPGLSTTESEKRLIQKVAGDVRSESVTG
jgi:hypothetical protein